MQYKTIKTFKKKQLEKLFLSVNWQSGKYPEKLKKAMKNSDTVISAWEKGELVGLMNAISDGSMNVYFPYLLIKPEFQGLGIGRELVKRMLKEYNDYFRKALTCYYDKLKFYEKFDFKYEDDRYAMTIENQ